MSTIIVPEVMLETDMAHVPMVAEAASVLWDALEKLLPVREMVNGIGAA